MKRSKLRLGNLVSVEAGISVLSSILVIGITYGSLSARVKALEAHPDPTPAIAEVKTGLDDLRGDVKDIKQDIKALLHLRGR